MNEQIFSICRVFAWKADKGLSHTQKVTQSVDSHSAQWRVLKMYTHTYMKLTTFTCTTYMYIVCVLTRT